MGSRRLEDGENQQETMYSSLLSSDIAWLKNAFLNNNCFIHLGSTEKKSILSALGTTRE